MLGVQIPSLTPFSDLRTRGLPDVLPHLKEEVERRAEDKAARGPILPLQLNVVEHHVQDSGLAFRVGPDIGLPEALQQFENRRAFLLRGGVRLAEVGDSLPDGGQLLGNPRAFGPVFVNRYVLVEAVVVEEAELMGETGLCRLETAKLAEAGSLGAVVGGPEVFAEPGGKNVVDVEGADGLRDEAVDGLLAIVVRIRAELLPILLRHRPANQSLQKKSSGWRLMRIIQPRLRLPP